MNAIEAKRAKEQEEQKEPEKKLSKSEKKKVEFEKKWKAQVSNALTFSIRYRDLMKH